MKNIFKKNQIIITALAIMIAIAGYLSFTGNDKPDEGDLVQTSNPDLEEYDIFSALEGTELATNTTDNDETTDLDAETTDDPAAQTDVVDDANTDTDVEATADDETVPVETEENDASELGDINDDDILQTAQTVSDTGELEVAENDEDGVPGEAVLVSTTIDAGFFSSAKLAREQTRARNKATLLEMIENTDISEAVKQDAINNYIEITKNAEKENAAELMLGAKGFDDAVVSIVDGEVDVVINATSITDQQIAIVEDVVKRKTDISVEHIAITPVVVSE